MEYLHIVVKIHCGEKLRETSDSQSMDGLGKGPPRHPMRQGPEESWARYIHGPQGVRGPEDSEALWSQGPLRVRGPKGPEE